MNDGATLLYRASKIDCNAAPSSPAAARRKRPARCRGSIHEGARDMARAIAKSGRATLTPAAQEGRDAVRPLKRILRLDRLRLRGPNGARDEFLLAATAQNLRKLAKLIPTPIPNLA